MSPPSEPTSTPDRARRLLRLYLEQRGSSSQEVARGLGTPTDQVTARLSGSDPVSLDWVEQVLKLLGVPPGEFFARLYSDEPLASASSEPGDPQLAPAIETESEEVLHRDEVEGLVHEARSLIRGATRMVEARARAEEESGV